MMPWLLFAATFAAALLLTGVLRRYALSRSLLDMPNQRSSHSIPTPRGGGMSIIVALLLSASVLAATGVIGQALYLALTGSGLLVAAVGFLDDHGHIPAGWRLMSHFAAAAWALAWLGGLPPLDLPWGRVDLGMAGHVLAAFYLVWLLNLYNFMDGIDGIASIEAITVCLGAALLYTAVGPSREWVLPVALAAATMGFLWWNYPPAKIFMGDAGSGFLGISLGVLSIQAAHWAPQLLWSWVILLGAFIVDATVTLFRRMLRGEKPHEAHRSHAYQYASRRLGAHKPVSLAVGLINLLWLLPVAWLVAAGKIAGIAGLVLAYLPLFWVAWHFKAGAAHLQTGDRKP